MTIKYKEFIEKLRLAMITEGGIPEERIRFYQEEAGPAMDDRLLVETVVMGDKKMVCGIHVGELYSCYQEGVSFTAVKEKVLNNLRMVDLKLLERLEQRIGSFEAVSEHLIIRAVSFPLHQSSMEEAVYRRIGDIALVVYTLIDERKDNISSVKINRNLLKIWGKSEDEVFQYAMENTMRRFPPRLYQLPEVLLVPEYEGIDFMDPDRQGMLRGNEVGNCISTTARVNGAVAIFMPGVAARIAEVLDADLYLAFTSIHEVMVHKADMVDPGSLEKVLTETIRETTADEEFLSRKLYHYSRETGLFSQITQIVAGEQ